MTFLPPQVADDIVKNLPSNFLRNQLDLYTWQLILMPSKWKKTLVGLLLATIIVVAAFNIVSSLVMVVTDKKSEHCNFTYFRCIAIYDY